MFRMLIFMGLLFGSIFGYKAWESSRMAKTMNGYQPLVIVSAIPATLELWEPKILTIGSLRAINGVDVTSEVDGLVKKIFFSPGQDVDEGEIILELNADVEIAQLKSLEAQAKLAEVTYKRNKKQYEAQGISKETLDISEADLKSKKAFVTQQNAIISKKIIKAPFKGRLGISAVNLGQYLNAGDKIVTLQTIDPIYADFYLPQQSLPQIVKGQQVILTTDTYPQTSFKGRITTINPKIDSSTRNVEIEATLENPDHKLIAGMYGILEIKTGSPKQHLTVPQTAISYNPYGDLVYVLKETGKDKKGNTTYIANQKFVTLGEVRNNQVQILKGLKKDDLVVVAGQMKLRNGALVIINNAGTISPTPISFSGDKQK